VATPLIILHGLFGAGDNWRTQAQALAEERPVLVPDMPNHGRSCHTSDTRYPSVAQLVWDAVDKLDVPFSGAPLQVLGHSMGGKVAMGMAFARPTAVSRLVVADIAPRAYAPSHGEIFAAMNEVATAGAGRRGEAERRMAERIPEKAVRLFLLKSLVPGEDGSYRWQLNLSALEAGYDDITDWPYTEERFSGESLFIAGGRSAYIQPRDEAAMDRHFPSHRVETIAQAGHWLHAEAREEFLQIVRAALS
jgi:pimeloyl-ACP methyl ester carboxylesterase